MKLKKILFFFIFSLLSCSLYSQKILIASAASLRPVLDSLIESFEKKNEIKVDAVYQSSGKLTAQIQEGAPVDVFLSADMKYPEFLSKNGFGVMPIKIYSKGVLTIWSKVPINDNIEKVLKKATKIAIANERLAPYGYTAYEYIKEHHYEDLVKGKVIKGESVSQVNQYISLNTVDVAFTSNSASKIKNLVGYWHSCPYYKINHGIVLLNEKKESTIFYDYLFTKEAQEIFKYFSYSI